MYGEGYFDFWLTTNWSITRQTDSIISVLYGYQAGIHDNITFGGNLVSERDKSVLYTRENIPFLHPPYSRIGGHREGQNVLVFIDVLWLFHYDKRNHVMLRMAKMHWRRHN